MFRFTKELLVWYYNSFDIIMGFGKGAKRAKKWWVRIIGGAILVVFRENFKVLDYTDPPLPLYGPTTCTLLL